MDATQQYRPSLRLCEVQRPAKGSCGFHLSRTQWDPYPWVSGVDGGSAAEAAGLLPGDCVLEVNGEDVLGERIGAVAARVRAKPDRVSLLLWNAGADPQVASAVCGAGPTPVSLQRLSSCVQAALQLLECPVCLEPAAPRAAQCANGHLLCAGCRARSERCPVCRVALGPRGRCLLADQLHALLAAACQPAAAASSSSPATSSSASSSSSASTAQRRSRKALSAAPQPPTQPLVQLKSRLILPPKSSSVEDICTPPNLSAGTPSQMTSGAGGQGADGTGPTLRARSLSTGQIPGSCAPPSPGPAKEAPAPLPQLMVHCPHSANCDAYLPASELLQHLREAHEGPLVQYFAGPASTVLTVRVPEPSIPETVAVSTAEGCTLFVCSSAADESEGGRLLWLWALSGADSEGDFAADLKLLLSPQSGVESFPAPVFPLTASRAEVVSSGRCLRLQDSRPLRLEWTVKPTRAATALG